MYAVADGVVEDLRPVYASGPATAGWQIVIRHRLPDNTYVYSHYLHLTAPDRESGRIVTRATEFDVEVGDPVTRELRIGRLAGGMVFGSHLHFEIRRRFDAAGAPGDNANGYYFAASSGDRTPSSMTLAEVNEAMATMREDGVLDPSDFIDDHRRIHPVGGNGSIISQHAKTRPLVSNAPEYPYGVRRDVVSLPGNHPFESGFFQWQAGRTCAALRIDAHRADLPADITVGTWADRSGDRSWRQVRLPFVLGESNLGASFGANGQDWYVVAVGVRSGGLGARLTATCTTERPSRAAPESARGAPFLLGAHQWQGNGSLISLAYAEYDESDARGGGSWPYGVSKDITYARPSQYAPAVFFQSMTSERCERVRIDAPDLARAERAVRLGVKTWNDPSYTERSGSLPMTVDAAGPWTLYRVLFTAPVSVVSSVTAECAR